MKVHAVGQWLLLTARCAVRALVAIAVCPGVAAEGPVQCSDTACNGNGLCHDGWCECYPPWSGRTCDYFIQSVYEAGGAAVPPLPATSSLAEELKHCQHWCSGHGSCVAGLCQCLPGWAGIDCSTEQRCLDDCNSPSGSCLSGHCVCAKGFAGISCADRVCLNSCWGHGQCIEGRCVCDHSWEGEDCDVYQRAELVAAQPADSLRPLLVAISPPTVQNMAAQAAQRPKIQRRLRIRVAASMHARPATDAAPGQAVAARIRAAVAAAEITIHDAGAVQVKEDAAGPYEEQMSKALLPRAETPRLGLPTIKARTHSGASGSQTLAIVVDRRGPEDHPCLEHDPVHPCSEHDFLPVAMTTSMPLRSSTTSRSACSNHCPEEQLPAGTNGNLAFSMTVLNVDYNELIADAAMAAAFINVVRQVVASELEDDIAPKDVAVSLSPGSVVVQLTISPPVGVSAQDLKVQLDSASAATSLARAVASRLEALQGIQASCSGLITISDISVPVVIAALTDADSANPQLTGKSCADGCSGHGTCTGGSCQCSNGWSGEACDVSPCHSNCNARGICLMGACACSNLFYGKACEYARCPNDCSGKGRCKEGRCICQPGFTGVGCQSSAIATKPLPVPSTARLVDARHPPQRADFGTALSNLDEFPLPRCPEGCNGQGICNPDGTCTCMSGFSGAACQDYCPNGCSGHGGCTHGVCLCMNGYGGPDCSAKSCCSGHGDCPLPDICHCDPGWMGEQCQLEMACPDPTCSSHGECKFGRCECTPGWSGLTCAVPPSECAPCPPDGACDRESGLCMCGAGPCEPQAAGQPASVVLGVRGGLRSLSPHGTMRLALSSSSERRAQIAVMQALANSSSDTPLPNCHEPRGYWSDQLGACVCSGKYFGQHCESMHCADWDANNPLVPDCNGKGLCVDGACLCAAGWGKSPGTVGPNTCRERSCPVDCGENGVCKDNHCVCQEGWQGPACRQPKCLNDCSGHGQCSFVSAHSAAECMCEFGYALPDCAHESLYQLMPACPNSCSGNGLCFKGMCVCNDNFIGVDCSEPKCPQGTSGPGCAFSECPRDCDGKGMCLGGQCVCDDGHTGPDCSIPEVCMAPCKDICYLDLQGAECEVCKGQCLTLVLNPVFGRHDPLQERLSTLELGGSAGPLHSIPNVGRRA